jgi:hypothetical protein
MRQHAAQLFGESFSKRYTYNSIIDFINFISSSAESLWKSLSAYGSSEEAALFWVKEQAEKLSKKLISSNMVVNCLIALQVHLLAKYHNNHEFVELVNNYPWLDSLTNVSNLINLGRAIGCQSIDKSDCDRIKRFRNFFAAVDESSRIEYLYRCGGPGLMVLIYSGNKEFYDSHPRKFPSNCLECDYRGVIQLFGQTHVSIIIGEGKLSETGLADGKEQIFVRLRTLKYVMNQIIPTAQDIRLVGHLFYIGDDENKEGNVLEDDISFYKHSLGGSNW